MRYALLCPTLTALLLAGGLRTPAAADPTTYVQTVSFESVNKPNLYIRHSFFLGVLTEANSALDQLDATFIRRPGLSDPQNQKMVSFESVNYPDYFLRHQGYRLKLQRNDGTDLFRQDASFLWRAALMKKPDGTPDDDAVSLESGNLGGYYIRHQNHELWLARSDAGNTMLFPGDASFRPWDGLRAVETVSFESVNKPNLYIRHSFFLGVLTEAKSTLDQADATFIRRPGLSDPQNQNMVSFESVNYPGYFLRHQGYRLKLQRDDGSDLLHRDASFFSRAALSREKPGAVSFESVNFRDHFIRHQGYELWLARSDAGNTTLFPGDASFLPRGGLVEGSVPCGLPRVGPSGPATVPVVVRTERVGQLTGNTDPEGLPSLNNNGTVVWNGAGVDGVDQGPSVKHKDRLYIFFGDVSGPGARDDRDGADLVGWTKDIALQPGGFTLNPVRTKNNEWFFPFSVDPTVGYLPRDRTPSGAFSYRVAGKDKVFVFALWSDPSNPNPLFPTTVLASKEDPSQPGTYDKEFTFSYSGFWSVNPIVVHNAEHPGLPSQDGDGIVLLAGGWQDSVHLAWMQLDPATGPLLSTVRYYTGDPGDPWTARSGLSETAARADLAGATKHEGDAKQVVKLPPYFSTVSAAWLPEPKQWILLYNLGVYEAGKPNHQRPTLPIVARFGTKPWAWSDEVEIFNPCRDLAYGHFMHWPGLDDIDSRVPPKMGNEKHPWALERSHAYGAFILQPPFTSWTAGSRELSLAYLMSTFNPYQVQVMLTRVRLPTSVIHRKAFRSRTPEH